MTTMRLQTYVFIATFGITHNVVTLYVLTRHGSTLSLRRQYTMTVSPNIPLSFRGASGSTWIFHEFYTQCYEIKYNAN